MISSIVAERLCDRDTHVSGDGWDLQNSAVAFPTKQSSMITWNLWVKKPLVFFPASARKEGLTQNSRWGIPRLFQVWDKGRSSSGDFTPSHSHISQKREKRRLWWENNPLKRVSKHLWKRIVVIHLQVEVNECFWELLLLSLCLFLPFLPDH